MPQNKLYVLYSADEKGTCKSVLFLLPGTVKYGIDSKNNKGYNFKG